MSDPMLYAGFIEHIINNFHIIHGSNVLCEGALCVDEATENHQSVPLPPAS